MKHATLPPAPWQKGELTRNAPQIQKLFRDVFTGRVDQSDLTYMAKAVLQMSDELHELRERVKALELALKAGRDEV